MGAFHEALAFDWVLGMRPRLTFSSRVETTHPRRSTITHNNVFAGIGSPAYRRCLLGWASRA